MNPYTESIKVAWQNPRHCFLNKDALWRVACDLAQQELKLPDWRAPVFPEADDAEFLEFLGVGSAINFCFTDFSTNEKFDVEYPEGSGHIWRGAFAMWASLTRALENGVPVLEHQFLSHFSEQDAISIFRSVTTPIPMLAERIQNLRNLGLTLWDSGIESFSRLFRNADFRVFAGGNGIVERLTRLFDCYNDISPWVSGRSLWFHKRAQLFPMMYHGRATASRGALQPLRDPERIGPIADYEVPRALRGLGILSYDPDLAAVIDNGLLVGKNSLPEIEIRAQTVHAMWLLLNRVNGLRKQKITMAELDFAIWSAGKADTKALHHRTITTAY